MTNALVYTMGIHPDVTSTWSVIGVPSRTIYKAYSGKIDIHEYGEVTGSYTAQALALMSIAAQKKYYPLAVVVNDFKPTKPITTDDFFAPLCISARIQFCIDTHYIIRPFFRQSWSLAMKTAPDEKLKLWNLYVPEPEATRHAITFIRRAKADPKLRNSAWGAQD